jgi:hypothetical protein
MSLDIINAARRSWPERARKKGISGKPLRGKGSNLQRGFVFHARMVKSVYAVRGG